MQVKSTISLLMFLTILWLSLKSDSTQIIDFDRLQLRVIKNFLPEKELLFIKNWIEVMMPLSYQDFDNRRGITWDDYCFNQIEQDLVKCITIDPVKKEVKINGVDVEQFPQSIFSYSVVASILTEVILPKMINVVQQHYPVPDKVYFQTFILRSEIEAHKTIVARDDKLVRWHQDPSDYQAYADFTMVLMLSDPFDSRTGWQGGQLLVKHGKPDAQGPAVKLTPRLNQALIFNNKLNSHAVTLITSQAKTTRDIMIINLYLEDPSNGICRGKSY